MQTSLARLLSTILIAGLCGLSLLPQASYAFTYGSGLYGAGAYNVGKSNSTTNLASSANPSKFGSLITLTATLSASNATGIVTFKDGSTTLGISSPSNGIATFSTSNLSVGTHALTAMYGGDRAYNGSISNLVTQEITHGKPKGPVAFASPIVNSINDMLQVVYHQLLVLADWKYLPVRV